MDELRFVLKCFGFAALLLVVSQIKLVKGQTIETQIHASLVNTQVADFINKAAAGGVKLVKNGFEYVQANTQGNKKSSEVQKEKAPVQEAANKNQLTDDSDESIEEIE